MAGGRESVYAESEVTLCCTENSVLNMQDVLGNSILHNVVLFDVKYNRGTIKSIYADLVRLGADQSMRNNAAKTPLAMAASSGHATMDHFNAVFKCFRTTLWEYGPLGSYTYDLETIDSVAGDVSHASVLTILIEKRQRTILHKNEVMKMLLEHKWAAYGRREYNFFLGFHIAQLCAVSISIWSRDHDSLHRNVDAALSYSVSDMTDLKGLLRFCAEISVSVGALVFGLLEVMEARSQGWTAYWFELNTVENILTWFHVLTVLLAGAAKAFGAWRAEALGMALMSLSAWVHTVRRRPTALLVESGPIEF